MVIGAICIILSGDSESLPLISLNMFAHILPMSRAFKSHRLVAEDLLCFISLGSWVMEIIVLRALFIIRNFLISMLSLWSRARYSPMWSTILLLFTFAICFLWVYLIKVAIRLVAVVKSALWLKPWSQMMLLYLWYLRFSHQLLKIEIVLLKNLHPWNLLSYLHLHFIRTLGPHIYEYLHETRYLSLDSLFVTLLLFLSFLHYYFFFQVFCIEEGVFLIVLLNLLKSLN